ncbi:MAG TPA: hypothetical protein VKU02_14050 [Gemmataceae bacterium]|nr:hypothetical protein [Gemmataceae bacterium]
MRSGPTGQELFSLKAATDSIGRVVYSPHGKRVASSGRTLKVWDAQTGQELLTLKGGGRSVIFRPNGHHLASATDDGPVMIWDATPLPEKP